MIVLNFSHPLTDEQRAQLEVLAGQPVEQVIAVPVQFDVAAPFGPQVAALVEADLDSDFVNAHAAALRRVTPEQATAALDRHLPVDDLSLVVVGDADALAEPLRAAGIRLDVV